MSSDDFLDDDPTPYILNGKNVHITIKYIEKILNNFGVNMEVKHLDIFHNAMTHISYLKRDSEYYKKTNNKNKRFAKKELKPIDPPKNAMPLQEKSYERLEFLGDSIIHAILANYLFHRYEKQNEGFMTRLRTKIENGQTLAEFAKYIGLNKYIIISRHIEENGGRNNNMHILEDSFEAFIGALYKECGYDVCRTFFVKVMEQKVDFALLLSKETNFKDVLLQYFHKQRWADPTYHVMSISGPEHKKMFTICVKRRRAVTDGGVIAGQGCSTAKKKAEQEAARKALIYYDVIREDDSDSDTCEELIDDDLDDIVDKENKADEELDDVVDKENKADEELDDVADEDKDEDEDEDEDELLYTTQKSKRGTIKYVCNECSKKYKSEYHVKKHVKRHA